MQSVWNALDNFWWSVTHLLSLTDVLDILIVAALLYQLVILTKQTPAVQVLKGLAVLLVFRYVSELIHLYTVSSVIDAVLSNTALLIIVLFQGEFRRALAQLGRGARLEHAMSNTTENQRIINEITQCCLRLSRRRVGALIVFEQKIGLKEVIETGTQLDAAISAPLLENIFEPNTPLHDGAVIIRGQRIVSAACVLTLSESNALSRELGTRHRAALGISETTDAVTIIVSEETGTISMTQEGRMTRHLNAESLNAALNGLYAEEDTVLRKLMNHLPWRRKAGVQ